MGTERGEKENILQCTNLELGNNDAIIIVISSFIFTSCWKLLRDVVDKFLISKNSEIMSGFCFPRYCQRLS